MKRQPGRPEKVEMQTTKRQIAQNYSRYSPEIQYMIWKHTRRYERLIDEEFNIRGGKHDRAG